MKQLVKITALIIALICLIGCNQKVEKETTHKLNSLKIAFKDKFHIGAAINDSQIIGTDTLAVRLLEKEFKSITAENVMKWEEIHPLPDSFYFDLSDKFITLGEKNDMHIVGHTLLWHSQIADFMHNIQDSAMMANHIEKHINTIVGRYKGRVHTWDVVNEALNEDGSLRESLFFNVMGEDFLELAFKYAATADPQAQLVYNDYNLWKPEKRKGVERLVKKLQTKGVKIDGVGMQAHWSIDGPALEDIENSIIAYHALGVKVMFTELDITVLPNPWDLEGAEISQNFEGSAYMDPYPNGLPDSLQLKLAQRYKDIFDLFLKHEDKISRVTFWGMNDGHSWLNNWPIKGRTNYPLLFDRKNRSKKAYDSVLQLLPNTK